MAQKMPTIPISLQSCPKDYAWYTIVTKFNYEQKFATTLKDSLKNSGMDKFITEILVPFKEEEVITKTKSGKEKKTVKVEKVYPGYVFVKVLMNEQVWSYIRGTVGVSTILAPSGYPLVMSEEEINNIKDTCGIFEKELERKRQQQKNEYDKVKLKFKNGIGHKVKITNGIFKSYEGVLVNVDFNKNKVNVVFDLNNMNVEVGMEYVELIS
jgi:transcriptional antiterminator NusG